MLSILPTLLMRKRRSYWLTRTPQASENHGWDFTNIPTYAEIADFADRHGDVVDAEAGARSEGQVVGLYGRRDDVKPTLPGALLHHGKGVKSRWGRHT